MCGIYGMVSLAGQALRHPHHLSRMGATLKHRGPDGAGVMVLPHAALGVNRLRIIDLDPRADQPFTDTERRVSLAVNGEIYNADALRRGIRDYPFRSRSDVEVVLPLYRCHGVPALSRLKGMFAIALWDESARRLVLARDRAGEKPLFYAIVDGEVWFASEVQALLVHPGMSRDLDQLALADFLALGYVREPRTMIAAIRKVPANSALIFQDGVESGHALELPREIATTRSPGAMAWTPRELESSLASLLEAAVTTQMVADVPVGVFLSGGLDSSIIAGIAARSAGSRKISTFSVRFREPSYDEGMPAGRVARQLGTTHLEVMADTHALGQAYRNVFDAVAEPIADPAILPTWLLARRARETVGVVLSGEGADELFGGYPTYLGHQLAPYAASWVGPLASLLPSSSASVPLVFLLERFARYAHRPWKERHLAWTGTGLDSRIGGPSDLRLETAPLPTPCPSTPLRTTDDVLSRVMELDYTTYLRDRLLPKIDRATMLASLEARAPYLDAAVTAFAFSLPAKYKVRGLTTKWLLKRVAARWVSPAIIRRRKHGLSVPISTLLTTHLQEDVDRLLERERLRRQGLLNPGAVRQLLQEHRAGNFHLARGVWALVVLQRWIEAWCENAS